MAEDFVPIFAEDFSRFAEAKGLKLPCPMCGHTQLMVHAPAGGERGLALMDIGLPNPSIGDLRSSPHVSLQCKNCGYNRLFVRAVVEDWLRDNP